MVNYAPDSRVVFRRGPNSAEAGAPAVIAYEDDRVKVAYYAFPVYLVPPAERALLVNSTVDWFTRKVLDPPKERDYEPFELEGGDNGDFDDSEEDESGQEEETGDESGDENQDEEEGNGDDGELGNQMVRKCDASKKRRTFSLC